MKHQRERDDKGLSDVASAAVLLLLIGACAPAAMIGPEPNEPGTGPGEQGAAQHRAAAQLESARLEQHKELYDPHAKQAVKRCELGRSSDDPVTPVCWVETVNPTDVHLQEVEQHRLRAVEHRRAARDLRAVEERACAGVADEDRDMSPFSHRGDILGVSPLEEAPAKGKKRELVGATIIFRAVPGLNSSELQRIVDCHLARNAAMGHDVAAAAMAHCPLTEAGASARVRLLDGGFAVDVRGDSADAAKAVWRRARGLATLR